MKQQAVKVAFLCRAAYLHTYAIMLAQRWHSFG